MFAMALMVGGGQVHKKKDTLYEKCESKITHSKGFRFALIKPPFISFSFTSHKTNIDMTLGGLEKVVVEYFLVIL